MRTPQLIYLKKSLIHYGNELLGIHLLKKIFVERMGILRH